VTILSIFQALDIADRAHLLDDIFSLAEAGLVSYTLAMDMTRYLTSETEYVPWNVASTKFKKFHTVLISSPSYAKLKVRRKLTVLLACSLHVASIKLTVLLACSLHVASTRLPDRIV
jgi:hypothetical protein